MEEAMKNNDLIYRLIS